MSQINFDQLVKISMYDYSILASRNRAAELVITRGLIFEELYRQTSYAKAAAKFNRSHATALNAIRTLNDIRVTKHPEHLYYIITRFEKKLTQLKASREFEHSNIEEEETFIYKSLTA
jgi:predicted aminopeptidase